MQTSKKNDDNLFFENEYVQQLGFRCIVYTWINDTSQYQKEKFQRKFKKDLGVKLQSSPVPTKHKIFLHTTHTAPKWVTGHKENPGRAKKSWMIVPAAWLATL